MVIAKAADGYRGYVTATTGTGEIRTGLLAGDFAVVVRNPQDTTTSTPVVSELGGAAAGSYTFLVPASFFATHGVGNYLCRAMIDTRAGPSGAPHVRQAVAAVIHVEASDLDDLRRLASAILGSVV